MAANSATAIPNAGMGAGTNNASAIVFRPIVWGDLDAVVDLFDRTWPQDVDKVGADMSRLISRYFVLHYLLPTTFANGAFAADGTLAGVTFIRVAGEAPQLDEIEVGEEMKALERRIDADPKAGVGGQLWRRMQEHFAAWDVPAFYLHTDSDCDVSFYDHKGLDCIAHRTASETVARLGGSADGEVPPLFDDMFIYRGKVTA